MKVDSFIRLLLGHNISLVKKLPPLAGFNSTAAAVTEFFKFPCKFNSTTGKCTVSESQRCCCHSCADNIGYFDDKWPANLIVLSSYAKYFDSKNGFWRKGHGCMLPRHMRSITCAYYVCVKMQTEFKRINTPEMYRIWLAVCDYSSIDYLYGGPLNWPQYGGEPEKSIKALEDAIFRFQIDHKIDWCTVENKWLKLEKIVKDKSGYATGHYVGGGYINYGRKIPRKPRRTHD